MKIISLISDELHLDSNGQIATIEGKDAYAQAITEAIRTIKGEVQSDTSLGVPYFLTIFDDSRNVNLWKSEVIRCIKQFDFVVAISDFIVNVSYSRKSVTYSLVVSTDLGNISIKGEEVA